MEAIQPTTSRRTLAALWAAVGALVVAVGWLTASLFLQSLRLAFAEAADLLGAVVGYYPPGPTQAPGSRLDAIAERARAQAVADIIAHLRQVTGEGPRPLVPRSPSRVTRWASLTSGRRSGSTPLVASAVPRRRPASWQRRSAYSSDPARQPP